MRTLPASDPPRHTHCPYCALLCAMTVGADGRAGPAAVEPVWFPTNRGGLCRKGWTSASLLDHPDRLTTPLVRVDGRLEPTDWDTALDRVVVGIRRAQAAGGPDGVAVFGGGGLTNEKPYQLGKFTRLALGSRMIDYNGRWCMSSAAAAANRSFGLDRGLPFPVTDLDDARAVLLIGANPADTMPPFVQHLDGAAGAGGLVVADPRLSATARRALDGGGVHLRLRPGTDAALALGLLHVAVLHGYLDADYVATRTSGFEDAWAHASGWTPSRTERVTGVSAWQLDETVRLLAESRDGGTGAYVLTARGAEQQAGGHRHRGGGDRARPRAGAARPAGDRLRHPHRSGERPGRARARPEGRPAARVPDDHRPCRARPAPGGRTGCGPVEGLCGWLRESDPDRGTEEAA